MSLRRTVAVKTGGLLSGLIFSLRVFVARFSGPTGQVRWLAQAAFGNGWEIGSVF